MDKFEVESYYGSNEESLDEGDFNENSFVKKKYLIIGFLLLAMIIFLAILFLNAESSPLTNFDLNSNGKDIGFSGTISVDGSIIDSFGKDGNKISIISNGEDNFRINIGTSGIGKITVDGGKITSISGGQVRITSLGGQVISLNSDAFIVDENGNIELIIDPKLDLGIDSSLIDFFSGDSLDFELQITFFDEDTGKEYTVLIPAEIFFSEFMGTGCIQLNREFISGTTKNGQAEINLRIRITCDSYDDLYSFVEWAGDSKGNVEIHFDRTYPTNLISFPLAVKSSPVPGEYNAKIIYTPHILDRGKKADFKVNFEIENSNKELVFQMVNENLEQCVIVTTIKDAINNYNDNASIRIDTTKCTNPIEISICHNDYGCSGGIEGEILPSSQIFTLNKSTRTINFSRGDIPGVYGVTIFARAPGTNFRLIDEKEILVLPVDETIFPKKFVVSLLGDNSREVVEIKNTNLTKDVRVDSSICNLYESSFGIDAGGLPLFGEFVNEKEWLNYLVNNKESYSGEGFYQKALMSSMPAISNARNKAYTISANENEKIKNAYLAGQEFDNIETKMRETSDELFSDLTKLDAELQNLNKNAEINLTSQMASLVTSMTSLYSDITSLSTNATATASTVQTQAASASASCPQCSVSVQSAASQMNAVASQTSTLQADTLQLLNTANDIYSIYQQIEALSNDTETIDSKNALKNSMEVNDDLVETEEKMFLVLDYLDKALASAAINSFETASRENEDAKYYLELALLEMRDIEMLTESILDSQLNANDDLTIMGEDVDEKRELIIASSQLLLDLINQTGLIQSRTQAIRSSLDPVLGSLATASTTASGVCGCAATQIGKIAGCTEGCCAAVGQIAIATSAVSSLNGHAGSSIIRISQQVATMNALYNSYQLYEALSNDFGTNYNSLFKNFEELTNDLYDFELLVLNSLIDLDEAVIAADNLSNLQREMSDASTYLNNLNLQQEYHNYDRERLVGLVSTLVQNGFINGAYAGGVYTTRDVGPVLFSDKNNNLENKIISFDSLLKEDCENRVELTLPAYKTNLINDAKRVEVEGADVATSWLFNNSKINGVYESQIVDLLFVNNNLKKNSYALVTIPFNENDYSENVVVNQKFAPFNLPSVQVKEKEYKFRMKFNAKERTGTTPQYNDVCENSLMLGSTGEEALPRIILDWDWDGININEVNDNYLDATQLSILVSKKLSKINSELTNKNINCPNNPVKIILSKIVPLEFNLNIYSEDCFLPLSTKKLDEKPALYYYFEKDSQNNDLMKLMDFNVNLIRDGYGREFQHDFVTYYTRQILEADPDFLDSDFGMSRYFRNSNIFYFTSKSINLESKNDFILNDTGLYNVKLLIDFDETPLISFGKTNAKIKVVFDLIEPINENFSPFYYLPINGRVGATIDNDRRFYGASVLGNRSFEISSNNSVNLVQNQIDSLVKVDYELRNDFFELNSLKSNKLKLLEINYKDNKFKIINSPIVVTPLLFEIKGNLNQNASFRYNVLSNERKLDGRTHNLFLFNSIDGCKDFYGQEMNYLKSAPDFLVGTDYLIGYENVETKGKVFAHTVAHAPVQGMFSIEHFQSEDAGQIISPNSGFNQIIPIEGIKGMNYNSLETNDTISDLKDLFNVVKEGTVCVSRLGEKEIYYWSEKELYEFTNPETNKSIQNEINSARVQCIN